MIESYDGKTLALVQMRNVPQAGASSSPTIKMKTAWKKSRPSEMRMESSKVVLSVGRIVTRHFDVNLTFVYDCTLRLIQKITTMDEKDRLVGGLPPDRLVYYNEGTKQLSLYQASNHAHIMTLEQSVESRYVSICQHSSTNWLAVTCTHGNSLDLYDARGKLQKRITLPFPPSPWQALVSVQDIIIITRLDWNLHTCSLTGERLQKVTGEELGIDDGIWGISPCVDGMIQIASGPHEYVADNLHIISLQ